MIRVGGTDGELVADILSINQSAENGVHYDVASPLSVVFEDGQSSASFDVAFIPGNHGNKEFSNKIYLFFSRCEKLLERRLSLFIIKLCFI